MPGGAVHDSVKPSPVPTVTPTPVGAPGAATTSTVAVVRSDEPLCPAPSTVTARSMSVVRSPVKSSVSTARVLVDRLTRSTRSPVVWGDSLKWFCVRALTYWIPPARSTVNCVPSRFASVSGSGSRFVPKIDAERSLSTMVRVVAVAVRPCGGAEMESRTVSSPSEAVSSTGSIQKVAVALVMPAGMDMSTVGAERV